MSNVVQLPLGQQITVAFYDGAWRVRAYRNGRGGPTQSFPSKEKANASAAALARIIRHNDAIRARNAHLDGTAQ